MCGATNDIEIYGIMLSHQSEIVSSPTCYNLNCNDYREKMVFAQVETHPQYNLERDVDFCLNG